MKGTKMTDRSEYIDGLRQLAAILEMTPDLPLPYHGSSASSELLWIAPYGADHKEIARTFARAIPGTVAKSPRDSALDLVGRVAGLHVQMILDRDQVCERVVTGVETVDLPATSAIPALPARTEEREVVEWRCAPLLAEAQAIIAAESELDVRVVTA